MKTFGKLAADTLHNNFYVDDMLKSVPTYQDAIELVNNVKAMCHAGGFNLTKFISNSGKVMESIPKDD